METELLMNGLLTAATVFAGSYCWILSARVNKLKSLDKGLGGSIVSLTRQVELARKTLLEARGESERKNAELRKLMQAATAATENLKSEIEACDKVSRSMRIEREFMSSPRGQKIMNSKRPAENDLSPLTRSQLEEAAESERRGMKPNGSGSVSSRDLPKPQSLDSNSPLRRTTASLNMRNEEDLVAELTKIASGAA
ncbi:hypothetical protein [Amaricoccus tamworthensis]|uniref:hypothetical protein n=1 Tax=Amaricoccus tamworthensis TaxID=57002 RepID=UPI003C7C859D